MKLSHYINIALSQCQNIKITKPLPVNSYVAPNTNSTDIQVGSKIKYETRLSSIESQPKKVVAVVVVVVIVLVVVVIIAIIIVCYRNLALSP